VKIIVCIPARYSSTRFPGKVLAKDTGKFLVQHTYERALQAKMPDKIIIAADNQKIVDAAESFGAEAVLTSTEHKSGTDRIAEAVSEIQADIVINLQADEPEIEPENIDFLAQLLIKTQNSKLKAENYQMATLAAEFKNKEQIADPNIVKVVTDSGGRAIYFSRAPIPYDREAGGIGNQSLYLRHIGTYAYRKDFLMEICKLPRTRLEKLEKLEQLRAIENGYNIFVGNVNQSWEGIDTPEQYKSFVERWLENTKKK